MLSAVADTQILCSSSSVGLSGGCCDVTAPSALDIGPHAGDGDDIPLPSARHATAPWACDARMMPNRNEVHQSANLRGVVRLTGRLALLVICLGCDGDRKYDLVVRGGRVLDGSGNPWFQADIGVRDGRITAVGPLGDVDAARVIEAHGRIVAPGFIDIHSHADDNVGPDRPSLRSDDPRRRAAGNIVTQGVTTVVVNHDGRSPWPIRSQRDSIAALGTGPNVMLMVGHGEVRRQVMGDDTQRPATPSEVSRMRELVRQALQEGAAGLSAGLEYEPGRWSTTEEVAALAEELVPFDAVYISHERSEGADPMWFWPSQDDAGPPTLLDALAETIEIGRSSGARVVASHIKAKGAHYWGTSVEAIELIDRARREGVRVWADQYPYATSGSDGNTVLIPRWVFSGEREESPADLLERALADPVLAEQIRTDVAHEIRRRGGADRLLIVEYPMRAYVGRTLGDVAAARGETAVEAAVALQLEGDRERRGGGRVRGFSMSEQDVEAYAAQPWVATASDGGLASPGDRSVHPRYYGTFPRKLRRYAIERGVIGLEDAVRSMTALPALLMGLRDRGWIRQGMAADLVIFDPSRIRDRATVFEPHQYAEGIDFVFVGGTAVVDGGELTWSLPGQVLTTARPR
jgi:N-acyl-D-amino-acid deacylase